MKCFKYGTYSFILLIAVITLKLSLAPDVSRGKLAVVFNETENSDCIFIKMPDGKTAVIDGGLEKSLENVHNTLYKYKVKTIDYMINTHQHDDHLGTFPELLKIYDVKSFYMPKSDISNDLFDLTKDELEREGVPVNIIKRGDVICDGDVRIEVLAPVSEEEQKNQNNYSAVLLLTYGEASFLFTGDAETKALKPLVSEYGVPKCDVLKSGHHGSKNANPEYLLEAVSPKYAVITAKNSDLKRLSYIKNAFHKLGTEFYFTCDSGSVTMICDGKNIDIKTERGKEK